jgi:hypothetical protein
VYARGEFVRNGISCTIFDKKETHNLSQLGTWHSGLAVQIFKLSVFIKRSLG